MRGGLGIQLLKWLDIALFTVLFVSSIRAGDVASELGGSASP